MLAMKYGMDSVSIGIAYGCVFWYFCSPSVSSWPAISDKIGKSSSPGTLVSLLYGLAIAPRVAGVGVAEPPVLVIVMHVLHGISRSSYVSPFGSISRRPGQIRQKEVLLWVDSTCSAPWGLQLPFCWRMIADKYSFQASFAWLIDCDLSLPLNILPVLIQMRMSKNK